MGTGDSMTARECLYRLLYLGLVDIRATAGVLPDKKVYHVASVFHTLPLQLLTAGDDSEYERILSDLLAKAQKSGLDAWLLACMKNLQPPDEPIDS